MNLKIKRIFRGESYTIGRLYVDGQYLCDTLEDRDRGLKKPDSLVSIKARKVYGQTAIPTGSYPVILRISPRFARELPALLGVPGFEGILIHSGNTHSDTSGCILVGENREKGKVLRSRHWEKILVEQLRGQRDITITIE